MSQTNIIVRLQYEAIHHWKDADNYLKHPHRHIFHVEAKKPVTHDDRDIEFIELKNQMEAYALAKWSNGKTHQASCEMMARDFIEQFDLSYCRVMEDNENGAEVIV